MGFVAGEFAKGPDEGLTPAELIVSCSADRSWQPVWLRLTLLHCPCAESTAEVGKNNHSSSMLAVWRGLPSCRDIFCPESVKICISPSGSAARRRLRGSRCSAGCNCIGTFHRPRSEDHRSFAVSHHPTRSDRPRNVLRKRDSLFASGDSLYLRIRETGFQSSKRQSSIKTQVSYLIHSKSRPHDRWS